MFQDWKDAGLAQAWSADSFRNNPVRAEHLDILTALLSDHLTPGSWILDLGYGSGIVEERIFQAVPHASVVGVDTSDEMMALAAERLRSYPNRLETVKHDLRQMDTLALPEVAFQVVLAVQSLHHLNPQETAVAYQRIYDLLPAGGCFLLIDRMRVEGAKVWPLVKSLWARQDRVYGSQVETPEGADFATHEVIVRERGDLPSTLHEHFAWLGTVGFEVTCLHAHANRAFIAAVK
jgi:SAM-dependent methyltransferase